MQVVNMVHGWNPYTLMKVYSFNKNQYPILFSGENCRNSFIIGNTIGNLCWKKTLYASAIKKFIYLKNFMLISSVKTIFGNCKFSSLKNKNILTKCDWNMKCLVLWKFTSCEWILSIRNSSYLNQIVWDNWGSTGIVLILKRRLINNWLEYLLVSRPKNWFISEITNWISSLNILVSTGKIWFFKETSGLKQVVRKECFCPMVASWNY